MKAVLCRKFSGEGARPQRRSGITLIEVLVAIFITGIGLLALLELFPLGVLELAQEIQDDRADKLALDAAAFSEAGADLVSRTEDFLAESLANGPDPQEAAMLRAEYENLELHAAKLQARLVELRPLIQSPKLRRLYQASLAEIKAIRVAARRMIKLLRLLEDPNFPV